MKRRTDTIRPNKSQKKAIFFFCTRANDNGVIPYKHFNKQLTRARIGCFGFKNEIGIIRSRATMHFSVCENLSNLNVWNIFIKATFFKFSRSQHTATNHFFFRLFWLYSFDVDTFFSRRRCGCCRLFVASSRYDSVMRSRFVPFPSNIHLYLFKQMSICTRPSKRCCMQWHLRLLTEAQAIIFHKKSDFVFTRCSLLVWCHCNDWNKCASLFVAYTKRYEKKTINSFRHQKFKTDFIQWIFIRSCFSSLRSCATLFSTVQSEFDIA